MNRPLWCAVVAETRPPRGEGHPESRSRRVGVNRTYGGPEDVLEAQFRRVEEKAADG